MFNELHLHDQPVLCADLLNHLDCALTPEEVFFSRVVRQVSGGRTVVDYINQMLLMEATFLLCQTSLSISQISDQLHFAEVTTFARFFNRMKGMTPREFRKEK